MFEVLAPGFLYSLAKDLWTRFVPRRRKLSASQIIDLRTRWKAEFEPHIWDRYQKKLRQDVIIRDMMRIDNYPDVDDKAKRISPWFRAGLVGTYHRGILIALGWGTLARHENTDNWRFTNYKADERGDIKVLMIGRIPYESIDAVDWEGDEFYRHPHLYCFFVHRREPYEHVGFYTERTPPNGLPFYTEVATYDAVRKLSRKLGVPYFG